MDKDKYIGRLLDNRYEILEVIGIGGMAVVYKARCHRLNRLVAIKILKDEYSQDADFRNRFHAEGQAVAMLSHPNIVSVYDVSTSSDADYIVMELIEGISLKQYMEKKGVLNWKETLHFGMQIAKALDHAHSRGIVHRDIKPHNVLVLKNGSVKVADFGIAQIMSKTNTLTKEALGSVHYISPEQAKGGRVDSRSDLYSLGVVMYEMMTGRPPYDGESPVAIAIQHINGGAPMPSTINANIPGGLEQIIMKAMAVDLSERYTSASQMLNDMDEFRKDPTILFGFRGAGAAHIRAVNLAAGTGPQTTAERKTAGAAAANRRPRTPEERRKLERQRRRQQEEENRSRITTIAIVACSVVAVIAIIIFMVMLLNGGFFNKNTKTVLVPNLQGIVYKDLKREDYPDVQIELSDWGFSDEYEKGEIMSQSPDYNLVVPVGSKVWVVVSMGPENENKQVMQDLTGVNEEKATQFLQDLKLNLRILPRNEYSDTVPAGLVTRTTPGDGETLVEGQIVDLWISLGPAPTEQTVPKQVQVPNVIGMSRDKAETVLRNNGFTNIELQPEDSSKPLDEVLRLSVKPGETCSVAEKITIYYSGGPAMLMMPKVTGYTRDTAVAILENRGFTNYRFEEAESDSTKGMVIAQSVKENTEVTADTQIVLTISSGPAQTEPPQTEPPAPTLVEKRIEIALPTDRTASYRLMLRLDGVQVTDETEIDPTETSISVMLTGQGTQTLEIVIDGAVYKTMTVEFGTDG